MSVFFSEDLKYLQQDYFFSFLVNATVVEVFFVLIFDTLPENVNTGPQGMGYLLKSLRRPSPYRPHFPTPIHPSSAANSLTPLAFTSALASPGGSGGSSLAVGLPASSCRPGLPVPPRGFSGACVSASSRGGSVASWECENVVAVPMAVAVSEGMLEFGLLGQDSLVVGREGGRELQGAGGWRVRRRWRRKKRRVRRRIRRVEVPMAMPAMAPEVRWWAR